MERILRFNILLLALFMIFGGSMASAQKNTIFGTILRSGGVDDGKDLSDVRGHTSYDDLRFQCLTPDSHGKFCFSWPVVFASTDFPCDLYAGLQIGDSDIMYSSLSDDEVKYEFNEKDEYYSGDVNFGCMDAAHIYGMIQGDNEALIQMFCSPGSSEIIGSIDLHIDVYCKDDNGDMIPVDFCDDKDEFSDVIYTEKEIRNYNGTDLTQDVNCSMGFTTSFDICCMEFSDVAPLVNNNSESNTINVSYQQTDLRFADSQSNEVSYEIYNISGIKILSGNLENFESAQGTIRDVNLDNGIYILTLKGDGFHSSHKFISFK